MQREGDHEVVEGLFPYVTPKTIPPSATMADTSLRFHFVKPSQGRQTIPSAFALTEGAFKSPFEIAKGVCTPAMTAGGRAVPRCAAALLPKLQLF